MNLMNIILNIAQICGNTDGTAMAIGVAPGYQYQDGKKTDTITYTKVNTVFVDNAYEKMSVKVLDTKPILTQETIELAGGKKIKFKNLTGKNTELQMEIMLSQSLLIRWRYCHDMEKNKAIDIISG